MHAKNSHLSPQVTPAVFEKSRSLLYVCVRWENVVQMASWWTVAIFRVFIGLW